MYKKRMNKKNWESAEQVFAALNDSFPYLVIRNYEDFYNSLLMDNHSDIDLLCHKKDRKKIIQLLKQSPGLHVMMEYIINFRSHHNKFHWISDMMAMAIMIRSGNAKCCVVVF